MMNGKIQRSLQKIHFEKDSQKPAEATAAAFYYVIHSDIHFTTKQVTKHFN